MHIYNTLSCKYHHVHTRSQRIVHGHCSFADFDLRSFAFNYTLRTLLLFFHAQGEFARCNWTCCRGSFCADGYRGEERRKKSKGCELLGEACRSWLTPLLMCRRWSIVAFLRANFPNRPRENCVDDVLSVDFRKFLRYWRHASPVAAAPDNPEIAGRRLAFFPLSCMPQETSHRHIHRNSLSLRDVIAHSGLIIPGHSHNTSLAIRHDIIFSPSFYTLRGFYHFTIIFYFSPYLGFVIEWIF